MEFLKYTEVLAPGLVAVSVLAKYGRKPAYPEFEYLIAAVLYSAASFGLECALWHRHVFDSPPGTTLLSQISWIDLSRALGVAVALAVLALYEQNTKLCARLLMAIGATKRYGEEDVWTDLLHDAHARKRRVCIWDEDNGVSIIGQVRRFSESGQPREIELLAPSIYKGDHLVKKLPNLSYHAAAGAALKLTVFDANPVLEEKRSHEQ